MALAEGDALYTELESFEIAVNENIDDWPRQWLDVRCRRDDLESVLVLLDESDQRKRLRSAMAGLDREGELVRLSVPAQTDDDERLRRAALLATASWWASQLSAG